MVIGIRIAKGFAIVGLSAALSLAIGRAAVADDADSSDSTAKPAAKSSRQAASAAPSMAEADELLMDNKFKAAEEAYRGLLSDDTTGDAYAGLAVALAKQHWPAKIVEAEGFLRKAKKQFPDNPNLLAAGGYVSLVHSKTVASPAKRDLYMEACESLCKRAIDVRPDILIAQQTLGLVKLEEDDPEGAIPPLRKAVELSDNPVNDTLLAQALLKLDGQDKEAADLVDRALKQDKNYHPARLQKAVVLNNQGKREDAFMELHNIPLPARTHDWYLAEGDVYRKQGDGPAALSAWKEAVRQDPHDAECYRRMGEYYTMRGDGELAISCLHDALEILPNDMSLRLKLAELASRLDKLELAEQEYKTILAAKGDDPQGLLGLSRVYFRRARKDGQYPPDWRQVMDQLQSVVAQETVNAKRLGVGDLKESIELSEGEKALSQNQFRAARQHFQSVINNHKDNGFELLTLGEQAFDDGDFKSAEQAFTYAKEIPEVAPRADQEINKIAGQRNEAARQTRLGDATHSMPEVAEDHYKQALIADPQYPNAFLGLFELYGHSKKAFDPDQAQTYATCFLEAADDSNPNRKEVEIAMEQLGRRRGKR
jgi:tetratricopeptide (TPR) repeat protein